MSKPEDIRKIFDGYVKKLLEQKEQMIKKINEWRNRRCREIDDYMVEEKKRIEQEHKRQNDLLEHQRQKFTKEVSSLEKKKDKEHIRHLVDQCKDLKFQLAALRYIKREVDFIQLMAEDQQTQANENKRSANEIDEKQSPKTPTTYHENITNNETEKGDSSSKPSSASERQTSRRSSITEASSQLYPVVNSDVGSKPDAESVNDATEKCPVCFMLFPQTMKKQDREQHVNEHYADDD